MLTRLFTRWRERRYRVLKDATDLTTWLGEDAAYTEARSRARSCRAKEDRAGDRHWSHVAVEIARRTGYVIGEKVADRYLQAREEQTFAPRRGLSPYAARTLADIAEAIAALTHGRANPTTLHNIGAWTRQLVERGRSTPELARVGEDLVAACKALADDPDACAAALAAGAYPELAEIAGQKLRRFAISAARGSR